MAMARFSTAVFFLTGFFLAFAPSAGAEQLLHGNGCGESCLNPLLLPIPAGVVDGVAYLDGDYLGCDTDRPANQQLGWHSPTLSYYYPPARICPTPEPAPTTIPLPVVPPPPGYPPED